MLCLINFFNLCFREFDGFFFFKVKIRKDEIGKFEFLVLFYGL